MSIRIYRRAGAVWVARLVWCRAVCVYDGDGFLAVSAGKRWMVRVWGIDAPEYGQSGFLESRRVLMGLVAGERLYCQVVCVDRYGRRVCRVWTAAGLDVGLEMVWLGWAWWYRRFGAGGVELRDGMVEARRRCVGLWAKNGVEPPWSFRRRNRGSITRLSIVDCGLSIGE